MVSLLVHYLDAIRYLFETDYDEVTARGRFDKPFLHGAESAASALLTTTGGAIGTMHANYLARKTPYCETFKCFGEWGVLGNLPTAVGSYAGPMFYGTAYGQEPDRFKFQSEGIEMFTEEMIEPFNERSFTVQLLEFADAVSHGREPERSLQQNLNTLGVIEAIYTSMSEGNRTVKIAEIMEQAGSAK